MTLSEPGDVAALAVEGAGLIERGGAPPLLAPDPERPVAIVFTSGTTGVPKGAVFCERQLAAVAETDTEAGWADGSQPGPAMLASTHFAHVGFTTKLAWYLRSPPAPTSWDGGADDAPRTIAAERALDRAWLPSWRSWCARPRRPHGWDHVRTVVGGAASPPVTGGRTVRDRFGAAYSIRYSSTESGGCGTGTAFDADDDEALHTVGRPRPGVEVAVRDEHGRPRPGGEVGELWLRSPTQMSGYWRDRAGTAATLVDGWIRTGDLARIDERGLVRLAGRSTEMFIRGGYNVYPAEVESWPPPGRRRGGGGPRPDPVMGEIGAAVVAPAPGRFTLAEVRDFLAGRLAGYKLPEALRIVPELPLTPGQKLDRRALVAHEAAQAPAPT
jgi:acyl-CoA synthetase (AMP-forming)/AMP-acid ligase II